MLLVSPLAIATAEVAKAVVTPNTKKRARTSEKTDVFFIFIIAVILSSIAFLLKLLHRGVKPLRVSSMLISDLAYAAFVFSPKSRTTASSQDSSISRFARTYIAQTKGLNQCTHSPVISTNFVMLSNRRICTYSCAKTYCSAFVFSQSVEVGVKITGRSTP